MFKRKKKLTHAQIESAKLVEKKNRMIEIHTQIGGEYLIMIKNLEIHIDRIITNYFCVGNTKRDFFLEHVLRGQRAASLAKKIEILGNLLHKEFPDFLNTHNDFLPLIKQLVRFRNELVHHPADYRIKELPKLKEDVLYLRILKNGKEESKPFKIKKIQKMIGIGVALSIDFNQLSMLIEK
ncbi:MAG: hypothetical protein IIC67_09285 [Thaumarchaeota archaeon]|nr:hypothetical protein [Nitrososphaerota archaeon]